MTPAVILACIFFAWLALPAQAERLDEMSLDRWKKLREVERYQLNIAEKYYRAKDYKVAMAEYEKYLRLYERSEAAPYAQLKWSICLVHRRRQNTAIRDGFQSVIDYWPDSPEARAAAYYIGNAYKGMGELKQAKKAYNFVLTKYPQHIGAVYARTDLADIARIEKDTKRQVELWKELTFDVKRVRETRGACQEASRNLASHYFYTGAFKDGKDALETTYKDTSLPPQVVSYVSSPIRSLSGDAKTKAQGVKLADEVIAYLKEQMPSDIKPEAEKARAKQYWFYIADSYTYSQRPAEVPKVYEQMTKLFGVADDILGRLAYWYRTQNRRDEARVTYRRFEDKPAGLSQVAEMYREEKKWDLAIGTYREIIGLDEKNVPKWEGQIAYTYRLARKLDEAIGVYQGLIKTDAEHANSWQWEIATTYRQFGKVKEAIAAYRLCENFPSNYWEMATCHRALKQYGEALVLYNQIMGGYENWAARAQLAIGYTYEEAGKKELAIKSFQRVCSKFPKTGEASRSHAHLQNKYKINTGGGAKSDADK